MRKGSLQRTSSILWLRAHTNSPWNLRGVNLWVQRILSCCAYQPWHRIISLLSVGRLTGCSCWQAAQCLHLVLLLGYWWQHELLVTCTLHPLNLHLCLLLIDSWLVLRKFIWLTRRLVLGLRIIDIPNYGVSTVAQTLNNVLCRGNPIIAVVVDSWAADYLGRHHVELLVILDLVLQLVTKYFVLLVAWVHPVRIGIG